MQWTGERNGEYRGHVHAPRPRACTPRDVEASRDGKTLGTGTTRRARRAGRRRVLRRDDARAAAASGSRKRPAARFYTPETDQRLPEDLQLHRPRRDDGRRARALAHADRAARCFVGLIGGEWALSPRRRHGVKTREQLEPRSVAADRQSAMAPDAVKRATRRCDAAVLLLALAAPARRRPTHLAVIVGLPAIRSTPSCSSAGPRRSSMRAADRWASRRITSSTWPRSPRTTRSGRPGSRRRRRSSRRSQARAEREAGRRGVRGPDRARHVRRARWRSSTCRGRT